MELSVPEIVADTLFSSRTLTVRDTRCQGTCTDESPEECTTSTQLVFTYRGVYVRHVGQRQTVAEANQVLFFNAGQGYRVSHPVAGGDASLSVAISEPQLHELAPRDLVEVVPGVILRPHRLRVDARTQALAALVRHRLRRHIVMPLEAECLALTLAERALGSRTARQPGGSAGRQRLVDRAKLVLASDLARRWTLADIAAEVRVSPVYLTQVFQQVEGLPLYRYQLRLRLARALDLLADCDGLTALALELGFSSHSHFSAAFHHMYGESPSQFRQSARRGYSLPPHPACPARDRETTR
jgi:AraC-like DNA-binding protein